MRQFKVENMEFNEKINFQRLELKEKNKGANPILIRIDQKAGHGAGKPTSKQIEEWSDIWSFVMFNLGMTPEAPTSKGENKL